MYKTQGRLCHSISVEVELGLRLYLRGEKMGAGTRGQTVAIAIQSKHGTPGFIL